MMMSDEWMKVEWNSTFSLYFDETDWKKFWDAKYYFPDFNLKWGFWF
jgi:hypothetical protein